MLSVAEALVAILKETRVLPVERRSVAESLGAILAETTFSDVDSPPFTKALMDGYALRAEDCQTLPATLRVIEEIRAGRVPSLPVKTGEATRIMTGAPVPEGADTVVMVERTEAIPPTGVRIIGPIKKNQNILDRASEMKAGEAILAAGVRLSPQDLGLLAAIGYADVAVHAQPRVAVLSTGDEVVEAPAKPGPGQIRNSNGPMLMGQSSRAGATARYLGIARDQIEELKAKIEDGLNNSNVLILSGGVSAGKFDLVPDVLRDAGVVSHFHKVAMKPGKPLFFGTKESTLVFGLPGNPASSFVAFELFIRPALAKQQGEREPGPRRVMLPIAADMQSDSDRPTYWPGRIEDSTSGFFVRALPYFGSADLRALHSANALLVLPPGPVAWRAGEAVPVIVLNT